MGMAASQARFLGLTARKTNIEYEGQQVNQQRTTLSNQSANYYNSLLSMSVPTPPAVDNFTKTQYSFQNAAGESSSITSMVPDNKGTYTVTYNTSTSTVGGYKTSSAKMATKTADNNGNTTYQIGGKTLTQPTQANNIASLKQTFPNDKFLEMATEDEDGNVNYTYYSESDLQQATANEENKGGVAIYAIGTTDTVKKSDVMEGVNLEFDASGRLTSLQLATDTSARAVTTSTVKDEDAYNDAMNQYEYDKAEYDKQIEDINSKIEIVQSQDKNLELRLKQLDTEQKAIQTEMEAVQKVIQKNTESSFKTFG